MVTQRIANPCTGVRFSYPPPNFSLTKYYPYHRVYITFLLYYGKYVRKYNRKYAKYVAITGDLFHCGHVAFLKKAKTFGGDLIVGVHSDADVSKYKGQPIMSLTERVSVIEACKYVVK